MSSQVKTELVKVFLLVFHTIPSFRGYAKNNEKKRERTGEKQQDENRLTDGCLKVDKRTQHQVSCGRLWFPPLAFEGPHIRCNPESPSHILLFHFLFSLHSKGTNVFFSLYPLRDPGPHICSSKDEGNRVGEKKRSTKLIWCLGHGTLRKASTAAAADWALTTENNKRWMKRREWKLKGDSCFKRYKQSQEWGGKCPS